MTLDDHQIGEVRRFLLERGLTFKPLLEEMMDHITADLEQRMEGGATYEEAWSQAIRELPENHFKIIQQETMETINRRFNLSRVLSFTTLGLLIGAALFKMLHLAGAGGILLMSLVSLAASMTVSSLSGIYLNRGKKGALLVLSIVAGLMLMLLGVAFKLWHLPGADQLIVAGVLSLITAMVLNSFYIYINSKGEGSLLSFLHEKYSPGIERFLLILLAPLVVYRFVMLVVAPQEYFANIILVIVIYGAGLQIIALAWRHVENDLAHRNVINLVLLTVSAITLSLPMLGQLLPFDLRVVMIIIFSICGGMLSYRLDRPVAGYAILVAALIPLLELTKLGWVPPFGESTTANIIIVGMLIFGIFVAKPGSVLRAFLILSLASFLLES